MNFYKDGGKFGKSDSYGYRRKRQNKTVALCGVGFEGVDVTNKTR
jgi:hypothetical protein